MDQNWAANGAGGGGGVSHRNISVCLEKEQDISVV